MQKSLQIFTNSQPRRGSMGHYEAIEAKAEDLTSQNQGLTAQIQQLQTANDGLTAQSQAQAAQLLDAVRWRNIYENEHHATGLVHGMIFL